MRILPRLPSSILVLASLLAAAPALLIAAPAAADNTIASDEPARAKPATRTELRLGTMMGGGDVGDAHGFSGGLHSALGWRRGELGLLAEFQYVGIGDPPAMAGARRGRASRAAAIARWNVLSGSASGPMGGDLWVEGGVGYEHVGWNRGGILDRPFVALGFGSELDGRPSPNGHRRHVGPYIGFRSQIAQGPDSDAMATCGGPCTRATKPSAVDASFYLVFGIHTGR